MPGDTGKKNKLTARRALEALRNGVPNNDAVKDLGCHQPEAERQFQTMLDQVAGGDPSPSAALGMLVSGEFGNGKSHLVTHLEQQALSRGFVCSKVTISKETPLYDLGKVFKSAVDHGRVPDRAGPMMEELAHDLNPRSPEYEYFRGWAEDTEFNGLSPMFPASLQVHEQSNDLELNGEIEHFWAGDRILVSRIKNGLRQIGQLQDFPFRAPKLADLPPQRLRFVVQLIRAAGYTGWVVFLDEIELVGSYSVIMRGRSYAELSRWCGQVQGDSYPGLVTVGTVTEDFYSAIIREDGADKRKRDAVNLLPKLKKGYKGRYKHLMGSAEKGMDLLREENCTPLVPLSDQQVQETMEKLRRIYSDAYGWRAPELPVDSRAAGYQKRMRYKVRAAINQWDLLRLYPDSQPETEGQEFRHTYEENVDLERMSKDRDG